MLDIKYIRSHKKEIRENINNRNVGLDLNLLFKFDDERREIQIRLDELRNEQKKANDEIARKSGKEKENLINEMQGVAAESKALKAELDEKEREFYELLEQMPNLTHPDSPIGRSDLDNVEIEKVNKVPNFSFKPKDHLELGTDLDILDFESARKVAGSKFYYSKNELVLLELALIHFALGLLQERGFILISTPDVAKTDIIKASGFNPRDDSDQIYNLTNTDLSLIATAEITIGGYHYNSNIKAEDLPLKYVGLSHCFRKEAGTYGQESRGLYRVHQFSKVEMYTFCMPDQSEAIHQELLEIEKEIFKTLEIPFRIVDVCTGDLGIPAYRKYDLEAWMPMRNGYGEITSTSNCTDFQARRLKVKYDDKGKKDYVHTLNGTAIAVSRATIAILENHQQKDGSVVIPKVLQPFMNNIEKITAKK